MTTSTSHGSDIADWRPEDEQFWESTGKKIAYRNLWISIPALLCAHMALLCGFAMPNGCLAIVLCNAFPFAVHTP